MQKVGIGAWSFVGLVAAVVIVSAALAAVSEIVLPLTFAAVLAVIFKPAVRWLERHDVKSTYAAGLVVIGLLALVSLVVATVKGVVNQASEIGAAVDDALDQAADEGDALGLDRASLQDAQAATEDMAPLIGEGFLTAMVSGVGTLVGVASGLILGALIMYYLLKDGTRLRRSVVAQVDPALRLEVDGFIGDSCRILRDYGRGRTLMSAAVSVVIGLASLLLGLPLVFTIMVANFIGGYIPYIGAFLGGGLAVIVAAGPGVAGTSLLALGVAYGAAWFVVSLLLPRATSDPSALLPGAALAGLVIAVLQWFTQLYLPDRLARASALYGSFGVAVATLGTFFLLGRVLVVASVLNAIIWERFGSIASLVFGLPGLRRLAERPAIARFFDLDQTGAEQPAGKSAPSSSHD